MSVARKEDWVVLSRIWAERTHKSITGALLFSTVHAAMCSASASTIADLLWLTESQTIEDAEQRRLDLGLQLEGRVFRYLFFALQLRATE